MEHGLAILMTELKQKVHSIQVILKDLIVIKQRFQNFSANGDYIDIDEISVDVDI